MFMETSRLAKKPMIIVELGLNHNGSLEKALEMVRVANECGVDAIKVQNWRTGDFVQDKREKYQYRVKSPEGAYMDASEPLWQMFQRHELAYEELIEIAQCVDSYGLIFGSTPSAESGVRDLVNARADFIKISSDNVNNTSLLKSVAATGKPIIMSTGLSDIPEIVEAITAIKIGGGNALPDLALLHCVSEYPANTDKAQLGRILNLDSRFDYPVGYSDHTPGIRTAHISNKSFGAKIIEKHFTLDKFALGPDHSWSADPREMEGLVRCFHN